jgi:hypothetical protein
MDMQGTFKQALLGQQYTITARLWWLHPHNLLNMLSPLARLCYCVPAAGPWSRVRLRPGPSLPVPTTLLWLLLHKLSNWSHFPSTVVVSLSSCHRAVVKSAAEAGYVPTSVNNAVVAAPAQTFQLAISDYRGCVTEFLPQGHGQECD